MGLLKKLSITNKLLIGFIVFFAITIIVALTGYLGMQKMMNAQKEFVEVRVPVMNSIGVILESVRSIAIGERGMMIDYMIKDPEIRKKQYSKSALERVKKNRAICDSLPKNEKEDSLWQQFDLKYKAWMSTHDIFIKICEEKAALLDQGISDDDSALLRLDSEMMKLSLESRATYLPINDMIGEMDTYTNSLINDSYADSKGQSEKAKWILIWIIIASLILMSIIGYTIILAITKPIKAGLSFAEKVANGDLTSNLTIENEDEIGQLTNALNKTVNKLHGIVQSIKKGSDNIVNTSHELNASSRNMSERANIQASASEEIAASMEEMSATIKQNAENSRITGEIAETAAKGIIEGSLNAQNAIKSMKEIADKVKIISDIAFQTNILALNAAVEAARAGTYGRGFSIVASEVGKLAEKSKQAAIDIERFSVQSVDMSIKAGNTLEKVSPEITKTANLIKEIALSSGEQLSGVDQIEHAMNQLNNNTQDTVSSSSELAASAEQLQDQAEQLLKMVGYFTISEEKTDLKIQSPTKSKIVPEKIQRTIENKKPEPITPRAIQKKGFDLDFGSDKDNNDEFERF